MSELVTCKDLTKRFGNHTALDHLNLSLDSGKIIGLLGPNGAGKTTLLQALATVLRPTAGTIRVCGFDAQAAGDVFLGLLRLGGRLLRAHHVAFERVVFKVDDLGRAALEP